MQGTLGEKGQGTPHRPGVANQVQGKYGVRYLQYWYNEADGTVFCLVEAPSRDAARNLHAEAHGRVADDLIEVKEGR